MLEASCIQVDPPQVRERIDAARGIRAFPVSFQSEPAIGLRLREAAHQALEVGKAAQSIRLPLESSRPERAEGLLIILPSLLQVRALHLSVADCKGDMTQRWYLA